MTVATNLAGVTVGIGFGVDAVGGAYLTLNDPVKGALNSATYLLAPDTVFVDVTANVAAIKIDRGRAREIDEYATGKASVVFLDNDRTFDPAYSGSPFYGQITPMRRIRIAWGTVDLFNGWIDDWSVTYKQEAAERLSWVTAECVDGFAILANEELAEIDPAAYSGDLPGARMTRVLDRAEVNFPSNRSIDVGASTLGATTLGGNVLTYLQECSRAENGYMYMDAGGVFTFQGRHSKLNLTPTVTFSDDRTAGVPYMELTQRSSSDLLFTRVSGKSESTDVTVEYVDSAAEDDFFIRSLALGTLLTIDDTQTANIVYSYLARFSSIEERFDTATVNLAACTNGEVGQVVGLELADLVTVERSPMGIGATISRESLIESVSHRIGHGSWTVEVGFSNADTLDYFTLNDAVLGVLDTDRLAV
jgi:hypothetical protein